jgi:hexosaminidase
VKELTAISPAYAGMGAGSLADGIFGGRTFTSGWLGYEGEDMIIEITPSSPVEVHRLSMNFLCDHVSWIFLPQEVKIEVSTDGTTFDTVASGKYPTLSFDQDITPVYMEFEFPALPAKKIRVTAVSMKKCPEWHRGAGMPSWIFCDEIVVE